MGDSFTRGILTGRTQEYNAEYVFATMQTMSKDHMLENSLKEEYNCEIDKNCRDNLVNMMTDNFATGSSKNAYPQCVFIEREGDDFGITQNFEKMLKNKEFRDILEEVVDFGISRYRKNYSNRYKNTDFVLYQKYTYEDACRILNWEKGEVALNIGGYKFDKKTNTFPVFINYDKSEEISDTTKYEDRFLNESTLISISKNGRDIESEDVKNFLHSRERGIDVQLFVRKNKDDKISKEFYYLGRIFPTGQAEVIQMPNTNKKAVEMIWELETPVREDLYKYIVEV